MRTSGRSNRVVAAAIIGVISVGSTAFAADGASGAKREAADVATFALVIGVNRPLDPSLSSLRYADDDAARYLELFRSLGARTYVLTRLDDNTRRLHPQVAAEAMEPRAAELSRATAALASDVARAGQRGVKTVLYVVYAGHGNVDSDGGYLALEDQRLTGASLDRDVVARIGAAQTHVIVDACHSYFLAFGRGPGGQHRELHGFSHLVGLGARPGVGLLLSTSSARESHEWSGFEAGVFSHEVRSGLYGAADADGDGRVSYREIAAFVHRANASIANERYRPDVFARSAAGSGADATLLDLRQSLGRRVEVDVPGGGHLMVEDTRGVRLVDFHLTPGRSVNLVRSAAAGVLYIRRVGDDREISVPAVPAVARTSDLAFGDARVIARGAANDAYQRAFDLPFGPECVADFRWPTEPVGHPLVDQSWGARRWTAVGGAALAMVAGGVAAWQLAAAHADRGAAGRAPDQQQAGRLDASIREHNRAAGFAAAVGIASAAGAAVLWFWEWRPPVEAAITPNGLSVAMSGSF